MNTLIVSFYYQNGNIKEITEIPVNSLQETTEKVAELIEINKTNNFLFVSDREILIYFHHKSVNKGFIAKLYNIRGEIRIQDMTKMRRYSEVMGQFWYD